MTVLVLSVLLVGAGAVILAQGAELKEERDYSAALNEALEEAHREVLLLRNKALEDV